MKNEFVFLALLILTCLLTGCANVEVYKIYPSKKVNCDILLNTHTGDTWYNCAGFWEKSSKNIEK